MIPNMTNINPRLNKYNQSKSCCVTFFERCIYNGWLIYHISVNIRDMLNWGNDLQKNRTLKGKFSSGIEGTLASILNRDFNWKQLSEMILCIFCVMFSKFIWVTLIQKQQKYKKRRKKGDFEFWAWASHFIMIWNITVRYKFWRTYFFQYA